MNNNGTTYRIGVVLDKDIKREVLLESLDALERIEQKHKCKFKFYESDKMKSEDVQDLKAVMVSCADNTSIGKGKMLFSFGGEMEL